MRLIRQSDVEAFAHVMEGFRDELTQAEADLNAVYDDIKADARRRLGRLYNPPTTRPRCAACSGWNGTSLRSSRPRT